jgi:hypothetical protein
MSLNELILPTLNLSLSSTSAFTRPPNIFLVDVSIRELVHSPPFLQRSDGRDTPLSSPQRRQASLAAILNSALAIIDDNNDDDEDDASINSPPAAHLHSPQDPSPQ